MIEIKNKQFDQERSLYNLHNAEVINCRFEGENDGESALKETGQIKVANCYFALRYPLWHCVNYQLIDSTLNELTRAPLWYTKEGLINNTVINGVKALRESSQVIINNCQIDSTEFGWKCHHISINNSSLKSEYAFLDTTDLNLDTIEFNGKYSFQYVKNLKITNSIINTKDAFWHAKNVVVENSTIIGEYLGWYADDITFINCHIKGIQPLCYVKKLKMINCTMEDADFAFEYSEVNAEINSHVVSIKNPKKGTIYVQSVDEVINEDATIECRGKVIIKNK